MKDENEKYVIFKLNNDDYGINIMDVQEIIPYQEVTKLPNSLSYISGVINHRGKIITIVDLNKRFEFNIETTINDNTKILILINNSLTFGIIVDEATNIINLEHQQIEKAPDMVNNDAIKNIGKIDNNLIALLSVEYLIENKKAV